MNLVFLISAKENAACGVGDYTEKLGAALSKKGLTASIEKLRGWSWAAAFSLRKKYRASNDTVFHLQYPSLNMSNSIAPGFLPLLLTPAPVYVTLHEFSIFNILRKLVFLPFTLFARGILLTNEYERDVFLKYFFWAKEKVYIVPIGNNIEIYASERQGEPSKQRLLYFGQFSEDKGIDFFIEAAKRVREKKLDLDIVMMGAMIDGNSRIAKLIRQASIDYSITVLSNLSSENVSKELSKPTIALLPFPDGITEKRGSALACLNHGNAVLTVHSGKTPAWMKNLTHHADDPEAAVTAIEDFLTEKRTLLPDQSLLQQEMSSRSWDSIAGKHLSLYH